MATKAKRSTGVPAGLDRFPKAHQRYILENHWPEHYATGELFVGTHIDGKGVAISHYRITEWARIYNAGVAWGHLMRRLYAEDVRTVPPIKAYHTEPQSAADLFGAAGSVFARDCAKLAEQDGKPYRLFMKACRAAEKVLAGLDVVEDAPCLCGDTTEAACAERCALDTTVPEPICAAVAA